MNMRHFPRLFVLILALFIAITLAGCDIGQFGFGGGFSGQEHDNDEGMGGMAISGGNGQGGSFVVGSDGAVGGDFFVIGGDGFIGVGEENDDFFDASDIEETLSDDAPADDGYKLPNGDSVNPQSVIEVSDGRIYVDYNFTNRSSLGGSIPSVISENAYVPVEERVYLLDTQKYAVVCFYDAVNSDRPAEETPAYWVMTAKWDSDQNYYNDILIKSEWYLAEDQFLLSSKEYVYAGDGGSSLFLIAANGKEYDSYEQRYDHIYYEYGVRVADAYNFPTTEIRYKGNTNKILTHYESTYDEYCTLINWKQLDESGVVYWEVNYADDGSSRILNTTQRRPDEGFEIYTEYENGMRKIAYQTFSNCPGVKDGTRHVTYYTNDAATHYDEFDPNGVLICTMYYDEEYHYIRAVYYDKEGNIIKEEHYD